MQRISYILFVLLLVIGCGDNEKTKPPATQDDVRSSESIQQDGEQKYLRYKFHKGEILKYKLNTGMNTDQMIQADTVMNANVNQEAEYIFELKVLNIDQYGIAEMAVTATSIKVNAVVDNEQMNYDSKFIHSQRERLFFIDYESIKNKTYKIKVNQIGRVVDIYSVEDIVNEMLSIRGALDSVNAEQKKQFAGAVIQSGIAPLTEQLFRATTSDPVKINSTWVQKYPQNFAGFQMKNIASFTVKEFYEEKSDSLAKINASLSIKWDGQNEIMEQGVKYSFSDPDVTGFGQIIFNMTKGCLQNSSSTIRMNLGVKMESVDKTGKLVTANKNDKIENRSKLELLSITN